MLATRRVLVLEWLMALAWQGRVEVGLASSVSDGKFTFLAQEACVASLESLDVARPSEGGDALPRGRCVRSSVIVDVASDNEIEL